MGMPPSTVSRALPKESWECHHPPSLLSLDRNHGDVTTHTLSCRMEGRRLLHVWEYHPPPSLVLCERNHGECHRPPSLLLFDRNHGISSPTFSLAVCEEEGGCMGWGGATRIAPWREEWECHPPPSLVLCLRNHGNATIHLLFCLLTGIMGYCHPQSLLLSVRKKAAAWDGVAPLVLLPGGKNGNATIHRLSCFAKGIMVVAPSAFSFAS